MEGDAGYSVVWRKVGWKDSGYNQEAYDAECVAIARALEMATFRAKTPFKASPIIRKFPLASKLPLQAPPSRVAAAVAVVTAASRNDGKYLEKNLQNRGKVVRRGERKSEDSLKLLLPK